MPEIIAFVEKIIANGYAYESQGSVYFDTAAFQAKPDNTYGKLCPQMVGNVELLKEGEVPSPPPPPPQFFLNCPLSPPPTHHSW